MDEYPHENGDVIVLGPQVFVSRDGAVLNWKGRNYVPQAERDRLRAVVEAARMVLTVIDSTPVGQMIDGIEGHDEITLLRLRLDQLDGSAEATDG
jgi:hypothetical protein